MIIPQYITNGMPSWETGEENTIQPYRLDIIEKHFSLVHPSGWSISCGKGDFLRYISMAVNGIISGRIAFNVWLEAELTTRDIPERPTGEVGDWFTDETGQFAQYVGVMNCFHLFSGEKRQSRTYVSGSNKKEAMVVENLTIPLGGNVFDVDYTSMEMVFSDTIAARGEILDITLLVGGLPLEGTLVGGRGYDIYQSIWKNGRFVESKQVEHFMDGHSTFKSETLTVEVVTDGGTFTKSHHVTMVGN